MPLVSTQVQTTASFRPRARLLQLLGEQLIRDANIAVFELAKNAYDADATTFSVTLRDIETEDAQIIAEDDGSGMTPETVLRSWLEPGTDYRVRQRARDERSPRFRRVPMGEKGVGRFAVHKLGDRIELVTRAAGSKEVVVSIDWPSLLKKQYLSDAAVIIQERTAEVFRGATGTRLTIRELKQDWNRRLVRELYRSLTAITSPFGAPSDFVAKLLIKPQNDWLDGMIQPQTILESALFHAEGEVDSQKGTISYEYRFRPPRGIRKTVAGRTRTVRDQPLGALKLSRSADDVPESRVLARQSKLLEEATAEASLGRDRRRLGPFRFEMHIFDFDSLDGLSLTTSQKQVREFLRENGGVRVYRDGIRVYDYGEPGDDWLGLDEARVNRPSLRISNNLVVGAITLRSARSEGLIEKTNREGFVNDDTYRVFETAVRMAVYQVTFERNRDKKELRTEEKSRRKERPVVSALGTLRERVAVVDGGKQLTALVDRAQREFEDLERTLLTAAGTGLTLATVVHEVEKGVADLNRALDRKADRQHLVAIATHLAELLKGLSYLTRMSTMRLEPVPELVATALTITGNRLRDHGIDAINDASTSEVKVKCIRRLVIASLLNLIDNAIYWLDAAGTQKKRLFLGVSDDLGDGPAIVVADSGRGFQDPPRYLVQPFLTRKPDGSGLGLYITSEVMRLQGGSLVFPEPGDVELPPGLGGATVALLFAPSRK
jgi:signal transduction histidine kinase/anti-sigma regulatory factor (Ser/Thr protein kinase)